ncbi:MAG: hypothetical protein ACREFO_01430 [Acetobacteraceae bacterium]
MNLKSALEKLAGLDQQIGRNWFRHARSAGAADDLLRVVIADGSFTTKIDGWIHAATLTTKSMTRFAADNGPPPLDMAEATGWAGGNAAVRYGRWQTDFHWKIDTRLWQYVLYLKFMRDAYRDAIDECSDFTTEERTGVHRLVAEFFDQAEIAMIYRWEFIERGRKFARHPDPTAGAATHGYSYRIVLPLPEVPFGELALGLDARDGSENPGSGGQEIPHFARLDVAAQNESNLELVAKTWLERALEAGVADHWLRVRLGERMVPTRFNGWQSAIEMTMPPLSRFSEGVHRAAPGSGIGTGLDLADYGVRFGLCHAELQRRLGGGEVELAALLEAERQAVREHSDLLKSLGATADADTVDAFFTHAADGVRAAFGDALSIDESWLPEIDAMRPLHPRFAPHDPLEPLPWEPKDPQSYRQKMERLGYVI